MEADKTFEACHVSINLFCFVSNTNLANAYPLPLGSLNPNFATVTPKVDGYIKTEDTVNFFPVQKKGANYLSHCTGFLSAPEKPKSISECVRRYTSGSGWFCTDINLALASDSPTLAQYGSYIKQLKYSIGMSPMTVTGIVLRGVDLSLAEVSAYEKQTLFFIPSFTSTSTGQAFPKNTIFHIDISPEWSKFCMEIQPEQTRFSHEKEVLFSCYNLYEYVRTEKSNQQRIIKLNLKNYDQYFNWKTNTIDNVDDEE